MMQQQQGGAGGDDMEYNPYSNDGKLLTEIMKHFPLNEDHRVTPMTVPALMGQLPELAQEVVGAKGGLLQYLQERRQLFVVRRAKKENGVGEAYYVAATNVAASLASQKETQLQTLKQGYGG
eukprot:PhM_4_TR9296/c0_g1_i1/m.84777